MIRVEVTWDKFKAIAARYIGKNLQKLYVETSEEFEIRASDGSLEFRTIVKKVDILQFQAETSQLPEGVPGVMESDSGEIADSAKINNWKELNLPGALEVLRFLA